MQQVDLTTTLLQTVHWATLLMGNTPLSCLRRAASTPGAERTGRSRRTAAAAANATGRARPCCRWTSPASSARRRSARRRWARPRWARRRWARRRSGSTDDRRFAAREHPALRHRNHARPSRSSTARSRQLLRAGTLGDAYAAERDPPDGDVLGHARARDEPRTTSRSTTSSSRSSARPASRGSRCRSRGCSPIPRPSRQVHYTISANVDCSVVSQFTFTAQLPAGFFPVNGSAQITVRQQRACKPRATRACSAATRRQQQKINPYAVDGRLSRGRHGQSRRRR